MSKRKLVVIFVVCIIAGVGWGLSSVFLLGNYYVISQNPADYPKDWNVTVDLYPPGHYSTFGKSVFFPGWASAQLTTVDGIIYYTGLNTDMYNPFLYLRSIGIATLLFLFPVFIRSVVFAKVRKTRGTL